MPLLEVTIDNGAIHNSQETVEGLREVIRISLVTELSENLVVEDACVANVTSVA